MRVDDVREALRRAESFGAISGIIIAQLACGKVLLRAEDAALNEAIDVLNKAHANMRTHKSLTIALPVVDADLAIDAARHGRIDEAIDELHSTFALHMAGGSRVFVGCAGEALVDLLIERDPSTTSLRRTESLITGRTVGRAFRRWTCGG